MRTSKVEAQVTPGDTNHDVTQPALVNVGFCFNTISSHRRIGIEIRESLSAHPTLLHKLHRASCMSYLCCCRPWPEVRRYATACLAQ